MLPIPLSKLVQDRENLSRDNHSITDNHVALVSTIACKLDANPKASSKPQGLLHVPLRFIPLTFASLSPMAPYFETVKVCHLLFRKKRKEKSDC